MKAWPAPSLRAFVPAAAMFLFEHSERQKPRGGVAQNFRQEIYAWPQSKLASDPIIHMETILILDNIRSTHNVGSIFRTADAAGIYKIYLVGTTPDPIDRFGREQKDIAKTALGAERSISWEHSETALEIFEKYPEHFKIALEQSENSKDYKSIEPKEKVLIILGAEVMGLPKEILEQCDAVAEIPMAGDKESLNVSVAAGIFLFRLFNI